MSRLVSSLYARGPDNPMTPAQQDEAAREGWRSHSDMVALRLSEVRNAVEKQVVLAVLERQHGKRTKGRAGR